MKNQDLLTNIVLVFWFGWFALAGVAIAAIFNWIVSSHYQWEDVLVMGATIGIITGGMAAITFFFIGKSRKLKGFGENFNRSKLHQ